MGRRHERAGNGDAAVAHARRRLLQASSPQPGLLVQVLSPLTAPWLRATRSNTCFAMRRPGIDTNTALSMTALLCWNEHLSEHTWAAVAPRNVLGDKRSFGR